MGRTEEARKDAENGKALAETKTSEAKASEAIAVSEADRANTNAELAKKEADRAKQNAQAARTNHMVAVRWGAKMTEELLEKVQSRRFVLAAGPEVRALREAILAIARERITQMAQQLQLVGLTSFAQIEVHQIIGDILRRVGRGEEALKHYQQGVEAARKIAAEVGDDKSRGQPGGHGTPTG